jgi:hypothetical protein
VTGCGTVTVRITVSGGCEQAVDGLGQELVADVALGDAESAGQPGPFEGIPAAVMR